MTSNNHNSRTGKVTAPLNDKGFTWVDVEGEHKVFLHISDLSDQADSVKLMKGSIVEFEMTTSPKGLQAKKVKIRETPKLSPATKHVVKDWIGQYGFLFGDSPKSPGVYIETGVFNLFKGYLRPGDVLEVQRTESGEIAVASFADEWDPRNLSPFEQDLDLGELKDWSDKLKQEITFERWNTKKDSDPDILRSYVKHTYIRQKELGHLITAGKKMCWNTGLVSETGDDVVAVFKKQPETHKGPSWKLEKFLPVTSNQARDWRDAQRAKYWDHPADLIYDTENGELTCQSEHIFDNHVRFPEYMTTWTANDVTRAVQEASNDAIKRVKQNYKTAIPLYYRSDSGKGPGKVQLLLPLRFPGDKRPSLALAVRRDGNAYFGATVLEIEWAYKYARLLTKPDTDWLNPFDTSDSVVPTRG